MIFANIKPIAFEILGLSFHWYGIFVVLGVICGTFILYRYLQETRLKTEIFFDFVFTLAITGIIGARIFYVIFNWLLFRDNLWEIILLWQGGFSFLGGFLGGLAGLLYFSKKHKLDKWLLLDGVSLALPVAHAIGSWGNFFTHDDIGLPTKSWVGMEVYPLKRPLEYFDSAFFHPTFIYESIWNLLIFLVLVVLYLKFNLKKGQLFMSYLLLYPLGRFYIESLRINALTFMDIKIFYPLGIFAILFSLYILFTKKDFFKIST